MNIETKGGEPADYPDMDGDAVPDIGSFWKHSNGDTYQVTGYADMFSQSHQKTPPRIIYRSTSTGRVWSRVLSDWYRAMKQTASLQSKACASVGVEPDEPTEAMLAAGSKFSSQPRATYKAMRAAALASPAPFVGEPVLFHKLPKGARFSYEPTGDVWVVLEEFGCGLIARWTGVPGEGAFQSICSADESEEATKALRVYLREDTPPAAPAATEAPSDAEWRKCADAAMKLAGEATAKLDALKPMLVGAHARLQLASVYTDIQSMYLLRAYVERCAPAVGASLTWVPSRRDMGVQRPENLNHGEWYQHGYTNGWNACLERIAEERPRLAALASSTPTKPPGAATPKGGEA